MIARWREDEKARSEIRVVLNIFLAELEHRLGILNNKYADVDMSSDTFIGDAVKKMNKDKSGITFNYGAELKPYRGAFDALKEKVGSVGADVSVALWRHYTTMEERLLAHENELDGFGGDQDKASEIRSAIRSETQQLIEKLTVELNRKSKRSFLTWVALWAVGRS